MSSSDNVDRVRQYLLVCENGDIDTVQALLDESLVQVDACDDEGNTGLMVATANGWEPIVRLLLMRGGAIHYSNDYGWTAVMQTCYYGFTNILSLLIQNKADCSVINRFGLSAISIAASSGHTAIAQMLLGMGVDPDSTSDIFTTTPLMLVAQQGYDSILRLLLKYGAAIDKVDDVSGWTALMFATHCGHFSTVQLILDNKANANIVNMCGKTALEIATNLGRKRILDILDAHTTTKPPADSAWKKFGIVEAAKQGNMKLVSEMLSEDSSQVDDSHPEDGATPLMFAAMHGQLDMVQYLVDHSAQLDRQDLVSEWTALMQATYYGRKTVAKYLISVGADVTMKAKSGCTAFDIASLVESTDPELLRILAAAEIKMLNTDRSLSELSTVSKKSGSQGETHSKTKLKVWWTRVSNRFRQLKLGRTGRSNQLMPVNTDIIPRTINFPLIGDHQVKSGGWIKATDVLDINPCRINGFPVNNQNTHTVESTLSTFYSLDMLAMAPSSPSSATLEAVIPPFQDNSTHIQSSQKSHQITNKTPMSAVRFSTVSRTMLPASQPPLKFLSSSSNNLVLSGPSLSEQCLTNSNDSQRLRKPFNKLMSSPMSVNSRDNVMAPSSTKSKSQSTMNLTSTTIPSIISPDAKTVHNLSNSSDSLTPRRLSSSYSSTTTSTMTPSPKRKTSRGNSSSSSGTVSSHSGRHSSHNRSSSSGIAEDDEVTAILKKLSLEKYQAVFEEQEVDMDAFLTLDDGDLQELGITHPSVRLQIVQAISKLNSSFTVDKLNQGPSACSLKPPPTITHRYNNQPTKISIV